ncbi:hypothetical protein [Nocardia carnea]|uniref:hypothetical protein n=1 Tax=Nocardia carnea TaxID=37328 RepID=UPI00245876E3|nr:hypothetical protein [Nocardia carnea]
MAADPWGALKDQAASGGFSFEKSVATDAARLCADLISVFGVVEGLVPLLKPMTGLGPSDGAERLRAKFDEVADHFKDEIMSKHRERVTDLGHAFVEAGKLYVDTDQGNAGGFFTEMVDASHAGRDVEDAFTHLDSDGYRQDNTDVPDLGNYGDPNSKFTLPAALSGLPGSPGAEGFSVEVPPADSMEFNPLWWLGEQIRGNSMFIEDKAAYWYRMKTQLETGFTDFNEGMRGLLDSDRWTGTGSDGAAQAVRAYLGSGAPLVTALGQLGDNLINAAAWIMYTGLGMPRKSHYYTHAEGGETLVYQVETLARQVYRNWYEPGIELSSTAIPKLPDPDGQTNLPPPNNNNTNNNNGGGGGGGGGGTGGGGGIPGGGSPGQNGAFQQQQAAVDQIEQQRAELLAAQQELERQAQQQQEALQQQQQALEQQQGSQQMLQAAQQGLQQLGQLGQQLSTAAQQALQQAGITGLPGMPALQDAVKNYQSALQKAGKLPAGLGGGGAGGSSGAAGGPKSPPVPNVEKASKLFPRAAVLTGTASGVPTGVVAASPAGAGAPMGGMPMGGGAGGAQGGGQQKDHKRADYLDSTEWLEEGIGEPSIVAKPVVDQ